MLLLFNTHIVISFFFFDGFFFYLDVFAPRLKDFIFISALGKTYQVFIEICVIYWSRNSFGILLLLYVMPVYYNGII